MNTHDPCARWQPLLPWYVNGTLSPSERAEVEHHLADCVPCQRAVAAWRAIAHVADTSVPDVRVTHSLDAALAQLHQRLEAAQAIVMLPRRKDPASMSPTPAHSENTPAPRPPRRTPIIAAISVALIAVLALAGFALLRPHTPQSSVAHAPTATPLPTHPPFPTATPFVCHHYPDTGPSNGGDTDKGITLHVDNAYADVGQTVITYHITSTNAPHSQFYPDQGVNADFIRDAQGHTFEALAGGGGLDALTWDAFAPFLPAQLTGPQTLTYVTHTMFQTCNNQYIQGNWQASFTVTPIVPHTIQFHLPPVTHSGVSVQPISLETSSGQQPLPSNDGQGSGARLILRIGNLTPAEITYVSAFDSRTVYTDGGMGGTSGAHLTVNGKLPATTFPVPGSQTSNSVDVEVLFWTPLKLSGATAQLTINRILIGGGEVGHEDFANGPWNIDLPLQ
jgi:hypothetical protein